ncbi:Hypothetical predicted protein [Octopus vulgaris]|uniref:Uncharacterized protein n=1 Tax=Octopus vulgaris TaxID=6645 RepID=A0AA36AXF6_OCTVU|nr:Hypothetical predicted protein [Octopus vulgaris]
MGVKESSAPREGRRQKSREMLQKAIAEAVKTNINDIELPETQEEEEKKPEGAKTIEHRQISDGKNIVDYHDLGYQYPYTK